VQESEFAVEEPLSESALSNWQVSPSEISVHVNSQHQALGMETACQTEWFLGSPSESGPDVVDVHLVLEPRNYGADAFETGIFIRCEVIQPMAEGASLDLNEWRQQFDAWWRGWEQHWADQYDNEEPASPSVVEDTFIPAGEEPNPNPTYRPPSQPPVLLDNTDVPLPLLQPLIDFHEAHHSQDWQRMAECCPDLDMLLTECSSQLQEQHQGCEFGRWIYLRHVDSWWQESRRACIVVRGIEHAMPDEEDPATNEETVVTYGLRKYGDSWIIWTWCQGWPQHGSAPALEEQQSWRDGWGLAE